MRNWRKMWQTQPKKYQIIFFILLILFILFLIARDTHITVPTYFINTPPSTIQTPQKKLKIALITDLHSCYYGEQQHEIMAILKQQQPDMILLVGDIYDDVLPQTNTDILLSQFKDLKAGKQVYYVNGNHELWLPKAEYAQVEQKIRDYGIHILHGVGQTIPQTNIKVWGVADPVSGQFEQQLKAVGQQADSKQFNILLSHRPEFIAEYLQYPFDLIVSGHAHGGQWRIPKLVNGVFAPNQGFLPKYAGGEYQFSQVGRDVRFIVSRGLAKESTRYIPRLFNRPEVVMIELNTTGVS